MAHETQPNAQPAAQPAAGLAPSLEGALRAAAAVRDARARLLEAVATGDLGLDDVLARVAADPLAAKTKTLAVIEAPGVARKVDIRRALDAAGIDHATPIGELAATLTSKQRAALETLLPSVAVSSL